MLSSEPSIRGIDVSRDLGLAPSTAHRLLSSLTQEGYARQTRGSRRYAAGPELLRLSRKLSEKHSLAQSARPHMETLSRSLRETVNLHILDGRETLCVEAVVENHHDLHVKQIAGRRMYAHASASGKVLLASLTSEEVLDLLGEEPYEQVSTHTITHASVLMQELALIRRDGYATAIGEREDGIHAVAVALRDPGDHHPVAALSVATPASRMPMSRIPGLAAALRRTSLTIAADYFGVAESE